MPYLFGPLGDGWQALGYSIRVVSKLDPMATTYRVKMLMLENCSWRVIPFGSLRDACDFRSKCEAKGWLATLMPPVQVPPLQYMGD